MSGLIDIEAVKRFMEAGQQPMPSSSTAALYYELVEEELGELREATLPEDFLDAIIDSMWVLAGLGYALGYDVAGAWAEVQRSNESKLVDGKLLKREDGKVLKPDTFSPPNLSPFI